MHIHLYISDRAPEGERFRSVLQDTMPGTSVVQHHSSEAFVQVMPVAYKEKSVAVIMVANREELVMLARRKNVWDRLWTILVLPDSEPETVTLGHALRPRFLTFTDSDFNDIVAVLNHFRESNNGNVCNRAKI